MSRPLAIVVTLGLLAALAAASPGDDSVLPAGRLDLHAQFRDGTRVVLPPRAIVQDPPTLDRRPIYLGAGLVVLALAFHWNRRRRDRFDREDDDGDDLHAAARGDAKDDDA